MEIVKEKKECTKLYKRMELLQDKVDKYHDIVSAISKIEEFKDKIKIPKVNLIKIKRMRNDILIKIEKLEQHENTVLKSIKRLKC